MKILLVNPGDLPHIGPDQVAGTVRAALYRPGFFSKGYFGMPLALPTLAAATPGEHTVEIVDEVVEPIDFDADCDLVGITAMTLKATRAYQIAREFRKRGVPVVMGGIHASMRPDEAAAHVDCVVVGEADDLWPRVLSDLERGELRPRYVAEALPDVSTLAPPRHDLTPYRRYFSFFLQTARGCPFSCNFCTVTAFSGRKLRRKSPAQVRKEIEEVLELRKQSVPVFVDKGDGNRRRELALTLFLTDDNFAINRKHALAVCEVLKAVQDENGVLINWFTQTSIEVGFDDELLVAMKSAGCFDLCIGFESLDPKALQTMRKTMNSPERYAECVRNIRRHGMEVYFSTIIGGDVESGTYEGVTRFVEDNDIIYFLPHILTPYPGTVLGEEMRRNGRIIIESPEYYNTRNVVFEPASGTPSELYEAYVALNARIFDFGTMLARARRLLSHPRRHYLTPWWRFMTCMLFGTAAVVFLLQGRLRAVDFLRLLLAIPRFILLDGSVYAIDFLATTIEFSAFAKSETQRLRKTPPPALARPAAVGSRPP